MNNHSVRHGGGIGSRFAIYSSILMVFIFFTAGYHKKAVNQGFSGGIRAVQESASETFSGIEVAAIDTGSIFLNNKAVVPEDTASRAGERDITASQQTQVQEMPAVADSTTINESVSNEEAIKAFAKRPIVFAGDSLMFEAVQAIKTYYEYAYITWYNEIKNNSDYGLHTSQLVTKVWDIISSNPRKVFIIGGTNDLWGAVSPEQAAWNIGYMVDVIKQYVPDCQIIIHSIPPFGRQAYLRNSILSSVASVNRFNALIKDYAISKQVEFVDVNKLYKDDEGYMDPGYTTDGIHIILSHYRKWIDEYLNKGIL